MSLDTNDYKYTEIGIALEDFVYGGNVNIAIPSLIPFDTVNSKIENSDIRYDCIINEDTSFLYSNKSKYIKTTNYFNVNVPLYLCDINTSPDAHGKSHPGFVKFIYNGTKGTKFLISFIGGNLSNPQVVRRL